ncbi:hypothetical protein SANTM175S_04674 [Streptomyces antimycoticus]
MPKRDTTPWMKDFKADRRSAGRRPGCADSAVLAAVQAFIPELSLAKENSAASPASLLLDASGVLAR